MIFELFVVVEQTPTELCHPTPLLKMKSPLLNKSGLWLLKMQSSTDSKPTQATENSTFFFSFLKKNKSA
ncbi:hypothetical protein DsansV1_C09g0093911 [Dioscorea sansibarensis]